MRRNVWTAACLALALLAACGIKSDPLPPGAPEAAAEETQPAEE